MLHLVIMVFWKETTFLLRSAMDSRWNKNVISLLSSVMLEIHLPISCVSCLSCKRVEDVGAGYYFGCCCCSCCIGANSAFYPSRVGK